MRYNVERGDLLVAHFNTRFIRLGHQIGLHDQAGFGLLVTDIVEHQFV